MALTRFSPPARARKLDSPVQGRILYVEDDDANWRITERYLRGKFEIERAATSREAFGYLTRNHYDLLLLDIELAGSDHDGLAICRIIRGQDPMPPGYVRPAWLKEDVPVVFVTAYTARYPREELLRLGGNEVVTKPVDYTRLLLVSSRLIVSKLHDRSGSGRPSSPR